MELHFSPEQEAFRDEVRTFAQEKIPASIKEKVRNKHRLDKAEHIAYQKLLDEQGWMVPAWPAEWGGREDWTAIHFLILDEELARAGAPRKIAFGYSMVGPVLIRYASEVQKKQHLPSIKNSDVWWCQGFSGRPASS